MTSRKMKVLVSGASISGLTTAFWMYRLGYEVTVVEIARGLRRGGTAVDLKDGTLDTVRRMGLLEQVRANRLSLERWEMKNERDVTERTLAVRGEGEPPAEDQIEIERDVLLDILSGSVQGVAELVFGDTVTALRETTGGIEVSFAKGSPRAFALVIGADGVHSAVRKLWFGDQAKHLHFLGQYFSITIVDKLLIQRNTAQMYNEPDRAVMLNAYKNKTDIVLAFASDEEIPYDYRDQEQQRRIIRERFARCGWRTQALLEEVRRSPSFYFDKMCQVRMPSWSKGRVALVGDAAYCSSPASGMGGSLAIDGPAVLADAMRDRAGDLELAFRDYDERFRPFIDEIQAEAVRTGVETLVPRTEEAIRARNAKTGSDF